VRAHALGDLEVGGEPLLDFRSVSTVPAASASEWQAPFSSGLIRCFGNPSELSSPFE
jgi:hypothetical protein